MNLLYKFYVYIKESVLNLKYKYKRVMCAALMIQLLDRVR